METFKYDNHISMIKMEFEITKIGERGQVVIPQQFRKEMNIQTGDKFMVVHKKNTIVLEKLKTPKIEDFNLMIKKAHEHAKKHNITEKDLEEAIKIVRRR